MKKFKKEKGITLVALIITIVVLLILAVVAIGAVQDSKIIAHAENAAGSFNQAKANEIDELAKYEETINKYVPKDSNVDYYILENVCIQKVDWDKSIITTYHYVGTSYSKESETPFEKGVLLVDSVEIMVNNSLGSDIIEAITIPMGAIPLYVNSGDQRIIGVYICEGKFYGMIAVQENTNIYMECNLVTDSSKIAEIESKIVNN